MFIPLYDGRPLEYLPAPYVNWLLIGFTIAVFFLFQETDSTNREILSLGLIPAIVNEVRVLPREAVWIPHDFTYVTYAFLHGDWLHLMGNMLFLWVFGDNIEDAVGHFKYLVFYLLCAIAAGLGHAAWFGASQSPLVGASGAVAGIIAAYLILYPNMRVWVLALGKIPLPITAFWCLGVWLVLQVYSLVFDQSSNVSWISHISGAAAGAVLILFFKRSHVPLFERGRRRVKSD